MSRGDIAERAAIREQEILDDALAEHARRAAQDRDLANQPTRCECGIKIPVARMQAVPGCKRCVDCQEMVDLMRKRK